VGALYPTSCPGLAQLALILGTGVALVFLIFGYANIPNIHRVNIVIPCGSPVQYVCYLVGTRDEH
jgi:hypothetical protein